jgi:hypothetical protein
MVDVPVPHPHPAYFPISPEIHKADLAALRGRDEHDEVLGPVIRLLVETRAGMLAAAEHPKNPNVERSVYRAAGVSTAIDNILAATRSGEARHQQTGFGKEE